MKRAGVYPHTSAGSPWAQKLLSDFLLQSKSSTRISTVQLTATFTAFLVKITLLPYHLWLLRVYLGALLKTL